MISAIKLQPDNAQAWSDRGVTWYLAGDYDKAVRDANEALRLDPEPAAHAHQPRRRLEEARQARQGARRRERGDPARSQGGANITTIAA